MILIKTGDRWFLIGSDIEPISAERAQSLKIGKGKRHGLGMIYKITPAQPNPQMQATGALKEEA